MTVLAARAGFTKAVYPQAFNTIIREIVAMDYELIVTGGDWNVALNPKSDANHTIN